MATGGDEARDGGVVKGVNLEFQPRRVLEHVENRDHGALDVASVEGHCHVDGIVRAHGLSYSSRLTSPSPSAFSVAKWQSGKL
ncbi:hypothetical protein TorRG33x02_132990 [Trema orientale]|uniref:Uncharacterized protein n=1 Tax=Trema orientale TaxID=63057 RepID=A0A2P5EZD7_TREOI|nr:hypothetical protein TorRG33x02_132990 [Trema orientale]